MVVLVPLRDRFEHLRVLTAHLERYLSDQTYRIMIIEQLDGKPFNRGALLNIGFAIARDLCEWVVFHDVDMLPDSHVCDYSRPHSGMRHLAGAVEQFGFALPYRNYLGGVLAATVSAFERVNGFSNLYWGWGCEDDDLFIRSIACGISIERVAGRYLSLPHGRTPAPAANELQLAAVIGRALGQPEAVSSDCVKRMRRADPHEIACISTAHELFRADGLSSLRYRIVRRVTLWRYLGLHHDRHSGHEVITVQL